MTLRVTILSGAVSRKAGQEVVELLGPEV